MNQTQTNMKSHYLGLITIVFLLLSKPAIGQTSNYQDLFVNGKLYVNNIIGMDPAGGNLKITLTAGGGTVNNGSFTSNGPLNIQGANALNFGYDVTGKYVDAGKISYMGWSDGLDIVGAGTNWSNRKIKLWAEGGLSLTGNLLLLNNILDFGGRTDQHIKLWGNQYGLGVQDYTSYFRSGANFAWFRGGAHANDALNAGGVRLIWHWLEVNSELAQPIPKRLCI